MKPDCLSVKQNSFPHGRLNKITDVKGVLVGHSTIDKENSKTGVTVIMPSDKNIFAHKLTAAVHVINGYGKTSGLMQIEELGILESPIALTNTLNVGLVQDALIGYMLEKSAEEGIEIKSINTVVGECNDSRINDISKRACKESNLLEAIRDAESDFAEGAVGAGRGTICHGLKGGIGSSSRVIDVNGHSFTLGVLVQSNYGKLEELNINGQDIGAEIEKLIQKDETAETGSIMIIAATDAPLSSRQLKRVLKRSQNGLARLGSITGNGSGEVVIGFSTANAVNIKDDSLVRTASELNENYINLFFKAMCEAVEEAVLHSLLASDEDTALDGKKIHSLKEFTNLLKNPSGHGLL